MLAVKVNAALKFLTTECDNGAHEIVSKLEENHPIQNNALLYGPTEILLPTYFDNIDKGTLFKAACLTNRTCGPAYMDGDQFRHILTSTSHKKENKDLRDQIAILTRKLASKIILDPNSLGAYVTCWMIPLNKSPGVKPIGVGEVLKKTIGKVIGWVLKGDI